MLRSLTVACGFVVGSACTSVSAHETALRSFEQTVADDLGPAAKRIDCGRVKVDYDELLGETTASRTCFVEAFRTCTAAQVTGAYWGMDSGPFYWSAAVVTSRTSGSCEIVFHEDNRLDVYGQKTIDRFRCTADAGSCVLVWREFHELCRYAAGGGWCAALPLDVRWGRLARLRDAPAGGGDDALRDAIRYDVIHEPLAPARRRCGDTHGTARDVLRGDGREALCFATAFAACEPAELAGDEAGGTAWIAIIARGATAGACAIRIYTDTRRDRRQLPALTAHTCTSLADADPADPAACVLTWREDHRMCRHTADPADAADDCVRLPLATSWAALWPM